MLASYWLDDRDFLPSRVSTKNKHGRRGGEFADDRPSSSRSIELLIGGLTSPATGKQFYVAFRHLLELASGGFVRGTGYDARPHDSSLVQIPEANIEKDLLRAINCNVAGVIETFPKVTRQHFRRKSFSHDADQLFRFASRQLTETS